MKEFENPDNSTWKAQYIRNIIVAGKANRIMRDYHHGHFELKPQQHLENFGMIHADSVDDEGMQEITCES
jgi:hypothetical protein